MIEESVHWPFEPDRQKYLAKLLLRSQVCSDLAQFILEPEILSPTKAFQGGELFFFCPLTPLLKV